MLRGQYQRRRRSRKPGGTQVTFDRMQYSNPRVAGIALEPCHRNIFLVALRQEVLTVDDRLRKLKWSFETTTMDSAVGRHHGFPARRYCNSSRTDSSLERLKVRARDGHIGIVGVCDPQFPGDLGMLRNILWRSGNRMPHCGSSSPSRNTQ